MITQLFVRLFPLSIEIGCNGNRTDTQINGMEWRAQGIYPNMSTF